MSSLNVDLCQLRYFKIIADARSFVRGADHLHIQGLDASWTIATSFDRIGSTAVQHLTRMLENQVHEAVASGGWPTARFDGSAKAVVRPCV
jgi:hypothetical protein